MSTFRILVFMSLYMISGMNILAKQQSPSFYKPLSFNPDFSKTAYVPSNRGLSSRSLHARGRNQFSIKSDTGVKKPPVGLMRYNNQNVFMLNVLSSETKEMAKSSSSIRDRVSLSRQQKASDFLEKKIEKSEKEHEKNLKRPDQLFRGTN